MFTGLIEKVGHVKAWRTEAGGSVLTVAHSEWESPLDLGESVAVQGACLTVRERWPTAFEADVLQETLQCTCLEARSVGAALNLERALRAGDRFGGHVVAGHVDGVGEVTSLAQRGRDWELSIECPALRTELVPKGSIAIDGVSLTLSSLSDAGFAVNLIPVTLADTSLSELVAGSPVNLEVDIMGKFARRPEAGLQPESRVDMDLLRRSGFMDG